MMHNSLSSYSSSTLTSDGLSGISKNPTTRTCSVLLMNTSCSQQVRPSATSFNTQRFLPAPPSVLRSGTDLVHKRRNSLATIVQKCFPHPSPCRCKILDLFWSTCALRLQFELVRYSRSTHFGSWEMGWSFMPTQQCNFSMPPMEQSALLLLALKSSQSQDTNPPPHNIKIQCCKHKAGYFTFYLFSIVAKNVTNY